MLLISAMSCTVIHLVTNSRARLMLQLSELSDAPLAPTAFEAFVKVPNFLWPRTQIYCTRTFLRSNNL
ncbi:hypothetical protein CMV_009234 [Castanea mollissima]|uniref:Uncharacterized protein n=1 Tax=Castanea mollissima TaxID=60419 RepID=A0A8J4W1J8_9ROSI|nr:hypothetical protein CMV_009234 [Castanea mollissima]